MKKLRLVGMAIALAAFAAGAKSLTVHHSQTGTGTDPKNAGTSLGIFTQELEDAAAEAGISLSEVTELTIISDKLPLTAEEQAKIEAGEEVADRYAEFNEYDIYDFRAYSGGMFKTKIEKVDMSQTVFGDNHLPTNDPPYLYGKVGAFAQFTKLKECVLPEGITGIPGGAFYGCTNLVSVNLPDGISTIPQDGFGNCAKLKLESLPANLINIYSGAFAGCTALALSELPATVKEILANAFNDCPNVTFSEIPPELVTIGEKAFRNSKVAFKTFPATLKTLEKAAFVNAPINDFTIPDAAGLWTVIPNQTFWLGDVERTFVCRSPIPPKAPVEGTDGSYVGVFGGSKTFPNITFKVLAEALESYQAKAPYSSMNLVVLTTAVPQPSFDLINEATEEPNINEGDILFSYEVNDEEYTDFAAVPESNEAKFTVKFGEGAPIGLYVKEIRYAEATAVLAEEVEEEVTEPDEDADLLYAVSGNPVYKKEISVPVKVTPDMRPLQVTVVNANVPTGIDAPELVEANVTRVGDEIYLSVCGAALYDMTGRTVAVASGNVLSMSALPEGIYILRAGKTVQKIVK